VELAGARVIVTKVEPVKTGGDSKASRSTVLRMFIRGMMGLLLKLHILQGCAGECRVFSAGVAGNGLRRAGRKRSIRRRRAKNGLGFAAEQGPILSETLGVSWRV